jgi:hypothetical protein
MVRKLDLLEFVLVPGIPPKHLMALTGGGVPPTSP